MKSKHSLLTIQIQAALMLATVGLSPVAMAQESDKAKQNDQQLERIMVTAQKRVQSTQEVPISVATLGGEKLDANFFLWRRYSGAGSESSGFIRRIVERPGRTKILYPWPWQH